MLALSDAATTGLYGVIGILFTTGGIVAVALIGRDAKRHNRSTQQTVDEFETAHDQQRAFIDQLRADLTWTSQRLITIEQQHRECMDRLTALEARARKRPSRGVG